MKELILTYIKINIMQKSMNYKNLFYTKGNHYAALLLAMKQNLESCYWEKGECIFAFDNEEECKKIIANFWNRKVHIEARCLFEAIRTVDSISNTRFYN